MIAKLLTREESKTFVDYKNIDYRDSENSTDYYSVRIATAIGTYTNTGKTGALPGK